MADLPDTVLLRIFACLTKPQLCQAALVCSAWCRLAFDASCWVSTDLRQFRHRMDDTKLARLIRTRFAPMLKRLDLSGFTLNVRVLQILTKHCPGIKVLCLRNAAFVGDFTDCTDSFPSAVEKLDIRHCCGSPSAFRAIARRLRSTTCLGVSAELFESLLPHVEARDVFIQLNNMRVLEFSYCTALTDEMVGLIAECCPSLEALCMRRCDQISGTTLNDLIDSCPSLTSLVLDGTSLSDSTVRAVGWERSGLRELDLSWCRHITRHGLKFVIPRLRQLRYLRLCCCGYGHAITDDVLMTITRDSNSRLSVLDLSYSWEVTNQGLAEFLTENRSLLYLRIDHCGQLTPELIDMIPEESKVFVVANFAVEGLEAPSQNRVRDSHVSSRDSGARGGFRRCVRTATPTFLVSSVLDNQMAIWVRTIVTEPKRNTN